MLFCRKFVVVFSDRMVFYDDETRSNVKGRSGTCGV
jgi:hypothetical protein